MMCDDRSKMDEMMLMTWDSLDNYWTIRLISRCSEAGVEEVEEVEEVVGEILNVSKFLRLTGVCVWGVPPSLHSLHLMMDKWELSWVRLEWRSLTHKHCQINWSTLIKTENANVHVSNLSFTKLLSVCKTIIMCALILILISYFCCNDLKFV